MGWVVRQVQTLVWEDVPVEAVKPCGGFMNTNHILLLVTCVLILCVLSFSVPPLQTRVEYLNTNHKTQHINIGNGPTKTTESSG